MYRFGTAFWEGDLRHVPSLLNEPVLRFVFAVILGYISGGAYIVEVFQSPRHRDIVIALIEFRKSLFESCAEYDDIPSAVLFSIEEAMMIVIGILFSRVDFPGYTIDSGISARMFLVTTNITAKRLHELFDARRM